MKSKLLLIAFILLSFVSCNKRYKGDIRSGSSEKSKVILNSIELIDSTGIKNLIEQRNNKILILNIWATWCQPCVEEFPDLIKLSNKNSQVEVVGVSVDYPDEMNSKILPFVQKLNVPFKIFVAKFDKQEDFISLIDSEWSGAIPATYIYDYNGIKKSKLIGKRTYVQFQKEIDLISNKR